MEHFDLDQHVRDPEKRKQSAFAEPHIKRKPISIRGLKEGISYHLGQCCHPLPGDRIVGLLVPGEGVVIHTVDCEELERAEAEMEDWIDVT